MVPGCIAAHRPSAIDMGMEMTATQPGHHHGVAEAAADQAGDGGATGLGDAEIAGDHVTQPAEIADIPGLIETEFGAQRRQRFRRVAACPSTIWATSPGRDAGGDEYDHRYHPQRGESRCRFAA